MPVDKSKYPTNWKQISDRIRFDRAGGKCEICGAPHGETIFRKIDDPERFCLFGDEEEIYWRGAEYSDKGIKVILTVAHLNHDTTDNREENLAALCQLHHLRHDAQFHAQNAKRTRAAKREEGIARVGQLNFLDVP